MLGLGASIDLGLIALAYRDQREPTPSWALPLGVALMLIYLVGGITLLSQLRRAIAWPDAYKVLRTQQGSALDLRDEFLDDFEEKLLLTRKRQVVLDRLYGTLMALLIASAVLLIVVVASTPRPAPSSPVNTHHLAHPRI